jgi:hypothetical protein
LDIIIPIRGPDDAEMEAENRGGSDDREVFDRKFDDRRLAFDFRPGFTRVVFCWVE